MSLDTRVKQRMADAVAKSYFKPWQKRWWAKVLLVLLILFIVALIYFIFLVVNNVVHFRQGDIYSKTGRTWITEQQFRDNQKQTAELLTDDDPWLGSDQPVVYIVAYESFGCPFCKDNQADLKQLMSKFSPLVRLIIKDFPDEGLHPNVMNAHLAAGCANEQGKFWEYRDVLFANQATTEHPEYFAKDNLKKLAKQTGLNMQQFNKCLDDEKYTQEIRQDFASGVRAGVIGTPSYLINGNIIPGEIKFPIWEKIIGYIIKSES